MELQQALVLFSMFVVGISKRYGTPTIPLGSQFSYSYSTSTSTFLQGRAHQRSGITLESTAVVEVLANCRRILKLQGIQIKAVFESEAKLINENDRLREVLERYPLWFCFHNGKVLKIFPQKNEPTWALNVKRGILSALQTSSPIAAANSSVEEVDISGKCPTHYQQKGTLLLKMKDFNLCSQHFSGFTSLRSVALPNALEQLLSSKLECVQRFEEKGILAEIKCIESHLVTPSARKGNGVKMQTQTVLKLFHTEADAVFQEKVAASDIYESSLLYEKEKMAPLSKEEEVKEVADVLQKLCMKPTMDIEPTDQFLNLVFALRQVSTDTLMNLWQRPSSKCRDNWQPLLDALPFCATEPCVVVMKKLIVLQEVEDDHVERFLRSLAFIPEPTAGMIDALAPLLELPKERQITFLGLTSLLHHFCSMRASCDQVPAVLRIMKILGRRLGRKCTGSKLEGTAKIELILNAIGNAGLAATSLTTLLSSCAALKSNPTEIRLAAIEAFRRIPCAANRAVLVHLFQTYDENVEIRIASYLMAMKCPSKDLFNHIKWTLQEEKSSQVGSFVWSHLSELLRTEDPLKQHLRNSLPEDIISKEFDWETWKFSSYTDVTFHSAMASGNAEAKIIFSPASFIPRSILTNFTIHLLGHALNLLEVGVRFENMEDVVRTFFDFPPVQNSKGRHMKPESPKEMVSKIPLNKPSSEQFSLKGHLPKENKTALRTEELRCPSGQYHKINEFVKKFTKRMGKKRKPKCRLSIKIFGNELVILDCGSLRSQAKHYYLSLAELMMKVLKGQEVQWNKRLSLATEEVRFPTISGFPVLLGLNASAAVNLTARGDADFKKHNHFFFNGYLKPSFILQISAQMGTVGVLGETGLNWSTVLRSSTNLDGGIQVKKGKEFKVFWNTPEEAMEIVHFSSQLYVTAREKTKPVDRFPGQAQLCTSEEVSKTFGWQLCSEVFLPDDKTSSFIFPFPGPAKVAVVLKKQDRSLQQYLIKAAYNYVTQKGSWIPNEAGLHFFIGTPKSELKRDVAFEFHWNIPQKKIRIEFIEPKTKIQVNGKIEISKYSRVGHLELIVNDNTIYYIKGRTDLQSMAGEQRYAIRLEAKLLRHGSPIVLAGNITKQANQKVAFSVSLTNLLKDAAFLAVCLEKKADLELKHYSLEGETHIPGVLGSHVILLLQHRGRFWSNILRIKYGLFGDAKKLQHECNMAQKLKLENSLPDTYRLDLEHEFHCTQSLAYNHKVHLHHEDTTSQLHSYLEANYGKHWDKTNNMRKVIISQMFKNHSQATLRSYFMEFMVQVPERNLDYRTRLQHSHSFHHCLESSTSFKVHYNNRIPFIADLQWKNSSGRLLKKWEGTFNVDTPWLYLYATHKFHQFQRSAYFTTVELTVGKALVVKGLVLELYCKDNNDEKESRIEIRTSTTTYLRASSINHFMKGFLHSRNEIMSLWNQLIKHEVLLESSEQTKFLHFRLTSAKKEFNLTAAYCHLEVPRKSNISTSVLWTDHKNPPLVLQFEAQIEEVKKEKMLYQKRGSLLFRHPLNLPIPQSFLLQETFTVDKKEKYYSLETKVVINELEDSIQTLTLGYPAKNPYICARLTHPYNSNVFPKNTEACIMVRNLIHANQELEGKLKINQEEVFSFLGKYQNKSSVAQSHHLIQLDITHSFQFNIWLNGSDSGFELCSQFPQRNWSHIPQSIQAQASLNWHGQNGLNGSFDLHTSRRNLVFLEANFDKEMRKNIQAIRVSAALKQEILDRFKYVWLHFLTKVTPARLLLSSSVKLNQHSFQVGISGSKEQKAGLVATLHGHVRHNLESLRLLVPQELSLNSSLKHRIDLNEGLVSVAVNQSVFAMRVRSRCLYGNESFYNLMVAMTQNGSDTFLAQGLKLKGSLEFKRRIQRDESHVQMGTRALCVDLANIFLQNEVGFTGTFTHNISNFYATGLPTESSIRAVYGRNDTYQTIALDLQGDNQKISVLFGVEKLHPEALQTQFTALINHSIAELKKQGLPSQVQCIGYYQNFSSKFAMGTRIQAGDEEFKMELENERTNSTARFSLFLHHNVGPLLHILPPGIQATLRTLLHGPDVANNCAPNVIREILSKSTFPPFRIHTACNLEYILEISFRHAWAYLKSLGLAQENRGKVAIVTGVPHKGLLEITLGNCMVMGNGELSAEDGGTAAEWRMTFLNKSGTLENPALPQNLVSGGSFFRKTHNASLTMFFQCNGRAADMQLEIDKYIVRGTLNHSLPYLQDLGLPPKNLIHLTMTSNPDMRGFLFLHVGNCKLEVQGEIQPKARTEWTLEMDMVCKALQDHGIPNHSQLTGSLLKDGCHIEFFNTLQVEDQGAYFTVRTKCQPKFTLEVELRHRLPFFNRIPKENKLTVHCGKQLRHAINLELKSGPCQLQANLEIDAENRSQWQAVMENTCKMIQDLGIPTKMNGSGHVLMDKINLDSQVELTVGENTFTGFLLLKGMATRQELHAFLDQHIKGAINFGIPARTEVDLISEKSGALCKRLLQFKVDGKQITEELVFIQKPDHVFLGYKFGHNLETLQRFWMQDKIELQSSVMLLEVKNITMKVQYGSYWIFVEGQMQKTEGKLDLTGSFHHKWPWLLQSDIPESLELMLLDRLSENETEASLNLAWDPDLRLSFIFISKKKLESEEVHVKSFQNLPFLLQYLPNMVDVSSEIQFLPGHLVAPTVYQKIKQRMQELRCTVSWGSKEIKIISNYTGPFPKVSGNHDLNVEICHPFSGPFPPCSSLNVNVEHSLRNHQDRIIISWDEKKQVLVSSSLKLGRAWVAYSAAVAHPFNFMMKHIEVSSLTEGRKGAYTQQMQLTWNHGQPTQMNFTFGDKSKARDTFLDGCITASSGQLKNILTIASLQACGSLKQTAATLNQHLDLTWDSKTVAQHLIYEKSKVLHREKMWVQATLKNLLPSCSHQHILGQVETDYSAWLNYDVRFGMCDLPNLKGPEAIWMDVKARMTSSADQSQVLVEGKMDHPNEKVKITVFKGKGCLQYYMGYLKGNSEDGLEFAACMNGQKHAALNAHLIVNRHEEMGYLTMEASNQSLNLKAHGCWDLVMKTESKLGEIASDLQRRLVERIKKLEEHIQDFRKSVQHIEFLYDTVGWSLEASKEMVRVLHSGMSTVAQLWEQSGFKHLLQDHLPLYLRKLQNILQQIQLELQKPLTTLKDVYYDVTLKPWDEVWQQKTDAYLKKLQALVPTVVKDVWLMEPIQVALRSLKTGFDMATQPILNWAEAKLSQTLGKLQKSLSNLYRFSARNCSVAVSLPVMPKGEPTLDLVNITNYIIEEKLMKPLRSLYNINLGAEYYKFKRAIMESPFEHHALLMGTKHLWTFDGKMYSLTSNCSMLLAKDFAHDAFTVVLNQSSGAGRSLYLGMNETVLIIHPKEKIYKQYNTSLLEDCGSFDIPLQENGITGRVERKHVEVTVANGALIFCDLRYDFCTLTLNGWYHGASAGLFGTNDNEAGNEWMLPDHSLAKSLSEFVQAWQVNDYCGEVKRHDKPCLNTHSSEICTTFFQDSTSSFKNCFGVVNPEPFYHWCKTDMCELHSVNAACNLAAAFGHLCRRNFVPVEMPLQCETAK
ncbi:uncharacterized protein PHA67_004969 isoform 2-T2 [Liasis olivaceus]